VFLIFFLARIGLNVSFFAGHEVRNRRLDRDATQRLDTA